MLLSTVKANLKSLLKAFRNRKFQKTLNKPRRPVKRQFYEKASDVQDILLTELQGELPREYGICSLAFL